MKNRINSFGIQWLFDEEGKGGGGGDDKAQRNLQNLLTKHNNDAVALAAQLLGENAELREKNRALKTNQKPTDAVVLSGDDVKKWEAFQEMGTPDDVKKQIADAASAAQERDELKSEKVISKAAALLGYKPDVLSDLAKSKGFSLEVDGEGDSAKAVVKWKEGDKESQKPLSEYVDEKLSSYIPSLKTEATPSVRGVPMPRGAAPGGGKTLSLADQIRAEEKAKKTPAQGDGEKTKTLEERMNMAY